MHLFHELSYDYWKSFSTNDINPQAIGWIMCLENFMIWCVNIVLSFYSHDSLAYQKGAQKKNI